MMDYKRHFNNVNEYVDNYYKELSHKFDSYDTPTPKEKLAKEILRANWEIMDLQTSKEFLEEANKRLRKKCKRNWYIGYAIGAILALIIRLIIDLN